MKLGISRSCRLYGFSFKFLDGIPLFPTKIQTLGDLSDPIQMNARITIYNYLLTNPVCGKIVMKLKNKGGLTCVAAQPQPCGSLKNGPNYFWSQPALNLEMARWKVQDKAFELDFMCRKEISI